MNSRLLSIIRKEFIQIWRDPRTLTIVLIIPILQLFLLGYSATNDVRNVPLAVYDQSHSSKSHGPCSIPIARLIISRWHLPSIRNWKCARLLKVVKPKRD